MPEAQRPGVFSVRTVESDVENILRKLDVSNRWKVAAALPARFPRGRAPQLTVAAAPRGREAVTCRPC
jgi:hypothetical protein